MEKALVKLLNKIKWYLANKIGGIEGMPKMHGFSKKCSFSSFLSIHHV